jgi:thiamine kinase-like enzyme
MEDYIDERILSQPEYDQLSSQMQQQITQSQFDIITHKSLHIINSDYSLLTRASIKPNGTLEMTPLIYGKGVQGTVYGMCIKKDCEYVVKSWKYFDKTKTLNEMRISRDAGVINTGPRVIRCITIESEALQGYGIGLIIMERMDFTLYDYLKSIRVFSHNLQHEIYSLILESSSQLGVVHGDLHMQNIMIRKSNAYDTIADTVLTRENMKLIDYGTMEYSLPIISAYILISNIIYNYGNSIHFEDGDITKSLFVCDSILYYVFKSEITESLDSDTLALFTPVIALKLLSSMFYKGHLLSKYMSIATSNMSASERSAIIESEQMVNVQFLTGLIRTALDHIDIDTRRGILLKYMYPRVSTYDEFLNILSENIKAVHAHNTQVTNDDSSLNSDSMSSELEAPAPPPYF